MINSLFRKQWLGVGAAFLVAVLMLAAVSCGESEPVVQTVEVVKEVEVTVEVPAETLDPLIVGHLNALTGSLSYFGESHSTSIGLAADHINRAGGIQGGSVILVHRDTGVNPVQGVAAAEELVNAQGVVAIVGALASGVTIPVATSVTIPNGIVQISGASTAPAITVLEDNDFLFRTALSDASQGVVLAELANELGYKTAGILFINNAYGEGLAAQFTESFTALGGTVTASVPHEDSQPTFVSELEKATENDPDVLLALSYQQAEVYIREALEGDYADTFLFVDGTKIPGSFEVIGWDLLEGSYGTGPGFESNPSTQAFIDSYIETYDKAPEHPFMNETYDAMILIGLAAAKAGTTTLRRAGCRDQAGLGVNRDATPGSGQPAEARWSRPGTTKASSAATARRRPGGGEAQH